MNDAFATTPAFAPVRVCGTAREMYSVRHSRWAVGPAFETRRNHLPFAFSPYSLARLPSGLYGLSVKGALPAVTGFSFWSESRTVTNPVQPFPEPKLAPAPRLVTRGTSVPFGLTIETASLAVSGVAIRNETFTYEIGPAFGT